nr:glycosyltransferase [uncultured Methanospirillum sp.]
MNILRITHSFYPCHGAGGVVKGSYNLSKQFVKKGHNVTVYTTDGCIPRLKTKKNTKVVIDGINVYYFRNISNWLRIYLKIATPYYFPFIIRKQIQYFDVIHIHEHRTILAIITHYYAKKYGIPYIIQSHGDLLQSFEKQYLKYIFDHFWGYKILRDATKAIALTTIEADQYKQMGVRQENIKIIPNAFDSTLFTNLGEIGKFKKRFNIPQDKQIILFLGRLHKIKGLDLLIESYSDICLEIDNVILVIVGPDDGYLSYIKKQIKRFNLEDKIIITGPLYNKEKFLAYVDADVYVLPSIQEAFPNTVLEALSCGTPVVVTQACMIANIIKENKIGWVCQNNKNQLSSVLKTILLNPSLGEQIGNKGKKFVKTNFDWKHVLTYWESVFEDVKN